MTAIGQNTRENTTKCESADADAKIVGCTALLSADQPTAASRATILENRSVGYYGKGDYDRALQDSDQAIHLNPNDPYSYYMRGSAYKKKQNFDRAIQDFNEAIRLDPKLGRAYYERGNAYLDKDQYDRAIQDFNEAIRLNPDNPNNYNNRGVAYQRAGDDRRAIEDYSHAISLNPNHASALLNRGTINFADSNSTAASSDFEHAISAAPSSSSAIYSALFLQIVLKRKGLDAIQQLARVASGANLSEWPGPLLKLYLGKLTADAALKLAANVDPLTQRKYAACQANYFSGEHALLHHQRRAGAARLQAARDGCPGGAGAPYRAIAAAEIKNLDESAPPAGEH